MKPSTASLIAGGIAIALAGGLAQGTEFDPTMPSDQPRLEDKPPGTPRRGNQGNNDRRGPPHDHGQHGFGNFAPPYLPAPPGHDRPDNPIDDGRPGLGLGRDPGGVCEADHDFLIPGPAGQAGASHTAHVNFIGLDDEGEILDGEDAPWGRMTYFWIAPTFDFVFNGHNLIVGGDGNIVYTLAAEIEDDEGEVSLLCLGSAEVNDGGNVHILNSIELDSHLPPDLELDDEGDDEGGGDADDDDAAPGVGLVLLPEDALDCETGETFDDAEGDVLFSVEDVLYVDTDLAEEDEDDGDG